MGDLSVPEEMLLGQDFAEFMRETEPEARLIDAAAFRRSFKAFRAGTGRKAASLLPWGKTHGQFAFRPGEVTEWMGARGHGKSMVLSHVLLGLLRQLRDPEVRRGLAVTLAALKKVAQQTRRG